VGRSSLVRTSAELRDGRVGRGLSIAAAARAAGISRSAWGRIELGQSPMVPFLTLARCAAVVGLDLSLRAYPGGWPVRDAPQLALLRQVRQEVAPALRWSSEVGLPIAGDQRAWDATISGSDWTVAVEAETAPRDIQATARRIHVKMRDGRIDRVLLVVRDTRRTRSQLAAAADELRELFPVRGRLALAALREGRQPAGSAILLLPLPADERERRAAGSGAAPNAAPGGRTPTACRVLPPDGRT